MRISKTALWLSVVDVFLVLIASVSGIMFNGIYARETPSWAAQGMSQDIVNLIAVVALLVSAYAVSKGAVKGY